ncbi:histone deacetylase [bacterium]|nr:histone deacetylase [bacterium]
MIDLFRLLRLFQRNKFPFKFVYSDVYWMADLGNHVFPVKKYRLIYRNLLISGAHKDNFLSPGQADEEDIRLVHTEKYLKKLKTGKLSHSEMMKLELPYKPELLKFARVHVGGSLLAARRALREGLAVHVGGGFHHAYPDHGEGFCMLNDVAVAVEKLRQEEKVQKAMIVDCDVHQGNGTAAVFSNRKDVFTFSLHQMDIYPARKETSSLDKGMWSGDGDEKYLSILRSHFPDLYKQYKPEIVFYLAGADPYERDQLGGLKLTKEGLKERDRVVLREAKNLQIPVVILLAGGYAYDVQDTVDIHLNTIKTAQKIQKK